MQNTTACLWFDGNAEEAVDFYISVFPNARTVSITRYSEEVSKAAGRPAGTVMTVGFELNGQRFLALNGGPLFKFSEAISFMVNCDTQQELDTYWLKLSEGGEESYCGWLKDKFGLSWQIVPTVMWEMMAEGDAA